jgi:hypothetical protein
MKYTVPTYKLKAVCKKLDELNNRIIGMEGRRIEYVVGITYEKPIYDEKDGITVEKLVEVADIEISNPVVSLNGWSFLAIIEHSKNGNIVMKKLYDVEIPEKYWNSDTYCEHCNTNRYRKFTYLVYRADTKEIHQVGSTCLTAYLGFDASLLMTHATFMNNLNNMMENEHGKLSRRGVESQGLETFLKRTIVWTERFGYVSAKKARENSKKENPEDEDYITATGYKVWDIQYNKVTSTWIKELVENEATNETYNKVIQWVNEQEAKNDYIHNIKTIVDRGYVTSKTATTAASIVGVWFMNLHKDEKKENNKSSEWFGNVKDRIDVDMILERRTVFDGKYGTSNCYTFETMDGNTATWFTDSINLEEGERYVGKATIAKHTEFKGQKQTLLNRCKLTIVE